MQPAQPGSADAVVLRTVDAGRDTVERFLSRHGMRAQWIAAGAQIPGSYWGAPEAGLIGNTVYVRDDTPLHSVLHEACHCICMSARRRATLHTDAGGDDAEEAAVCYLQVELAGGLGVSRERLFADMDAWGYSFRLGGARAWFENDAEDARAWLVARGLLDRTGGTAVCTDQSR